MTSDRWYHAHPEYKALWPMLKQIDEDELRRQLNTAHRQLQEQQRQIDSLTDTIRELRAQRDCNDKYMGQDTSQTHDQQ